MSGDSKSELLGAVNTTDEMRDVFKCGCNASARFIPLYRFNLSGVKPSVVMGPLHPAAIKCANCGQMFQWRQPTEGKRDGGWMRQSPLDDLIELEAASA